MKHWHLLGNGASNCYYTPQDGLIIGFNIPTYKHKLDLIGIIDALSVRSYHTNNLEPRAPVLTTDRCLEAVNKLSIKGIYSPVLKVKYRRQNSAHCTLDYLLGIQTPEQIDLWGFDSLFSDDLTSQMDTYVPRPNRPSLNQSWHPHWQQLFKDYNNTQWTLHIPQGETASVTATNLTIQHH